MPRYANREMLTPALPCPGGIPARPEKEEWEGKIYTVRFDDGSGRVMKLRARRATPEERAAASKWLNERHAEDLQALADI